MTTHAEMFRMEREGGWVKIPDSMFAHPVAVSSHTHHSVISGHYVKRNMEMANRKNQDKDELERQPGRFHGDVDPVEHQKRLEREAEEKDKEDVAKDDKRGKR